jgi:hypothetical protein
VNVGATPTLAAHLELSVTKAVPGQSVRYSVVNQGPVPIMLGEAYALERLTDHGWERLPSLAFRAIGYYLVEGASRELYFRVPEDARPGAYRFCKRVRADSDPRPGSEWLRGHHIDPIELAADFEVVAG